MDGPQSSHVLSPRAIFCFQANEFVCQTFDGNFMAGPGCPAFVLLQTLRRFMAPFGEHPHAAPCRPSAAHMRTRGRCTITGPCMAPFPCRPEPDLASLRKGRAHQQRTVQ